MLCVQSRSHLRLNRLALFGDFCQLSACSCALLGETVFVPLATRLDQRRRKGLRELDLEVAVRTDDNGYAHDADVSGQYAAIPILMTGRCSNAGVVGLVRRKAKPKGVTTWLAGADQTSHAIMMCC